ncbi:MAG: glycosyltransferase, partial [Thermodesulfobacteriota bacterium]
YNGAKVLEVCLDSVFQQAFPYPVEVIVHDDASTDGSAAIVADKYPAVRLIQSQTNVGFCVSNNRMAAAARGRFLLLLNNDAALHRDALATLYDAAVAQDVYGIIGLPQYSMETGERIDRGSLLDPFCNPIPNLKQSRRAVGMVIGACMWLPRLLWEELGGFPEWFESLAEDMYLCCRARLKGYPVITLSLSGFDHWVGGSFGGGKVVANTLQTTYRRRARSERNKSYLMFLCYPPPLAQVLIPLHLLLLAAEGLLLSLIKKEGRVWNEIYRPCFSALWRRRRMLISLRREIQAGRQVSLRTFCSVHTFWPHKLTMLVKYGLPALK